MTQSDYAATAQTFDRFAREIVTLARRIRCALDEGEDSPDADEIGVCELEWLADECDERARDAFARSTPRRRVRRSRRRVRRAA